MKKLTALEKEYLMERCIHSVTAQRCWRLRAKLELAGLTKARNEYLNTRFAQAMKATRS